MIVCAADLADRFEDGQITADQYRRGIEDVGSHCRDLIVRANRGRNAAETAELLLRTRL